jgi:DNA-directed RNA polymerase specialized sigma24 family protein
MPQDSRVLEIMSAQSKLPQDLQLVFDALYLDGLTEAGASARLSISLSELQSRRARMLKSLKAAVN